MHLLHLCAYKLRATDSNFTVEQDAHFVSVFVYHPGRDLATFTYVRRRRRVQRAKHSSV